VVGEKGFCTVDALDVLFEELKGLHHVEDSEVRISLPGSLKEELGREEERGEREGRRVAGREGGRGGGEVRAEGGGRDA
jgi:hypothetical protein